MLAYCKGGLTTCEDCRGSCGIEEFQERVDQIRSLLASRAVSRAPQGWAEVLNAARDLLRMLERAGV